MGLFEADKGNLFKHLILLYLKITKFYTEDGNG